MVPWSYVQYNSGVVVVFDLFCSSVNSYEDNKGENVGTSNRYLSFILSVFWKINSLSSR